MTEQITIRVYNKEPVLFAKGGLARTAEKVREAGEEDDDILLHVSPEEFEVLQAQWGPAEINPVTGLPEYGWLSKKFKSLKKYVKKIAKRGLKAPFTNPLKTLKESLQDPVVRTVGPWVLNAFLPGAGTAVGTALGASGALAPVVGQAVIQGGLGAASAYAGDGDIGQGALRGALSGAVSGGLGSMAGAKLGFEGATADIVGSGLVGGLGAGVTGEDPLTGALTSGLGAVARQYLPTPGSPRSDPLPQGAPGMVIGEGGVPMISPTVTVGGTAQAPVGGDYQGWGMAGRGAAPAPAAAPAAGGKSDLVDMAIKYGLPLLGAAGARGEYDDAPPEWMDEGFGDPLPQYDLERQFQGLQDPASYYTYGQAGAPVSGQHLFISPADPFAGETAPGGLEAVAGSQSPVPIQPGPAGAAQRQQLEDQGWTYDEESQMMYPPEQTGAARGGYQRGGEFDYWSQNDDVFSTAPGVSARGGAYAQGPGTGRSDDINAKLSDGEYVMDAETVALLGDGSGAAGARRLDEMRKNLRKHKAKNLGKGEFSHKAKKPAGYMGKMRRLRRAKKYEHGGVSNVAGTSPIHHSIATGGNV